MRSSSKDKEIKKAIEKMKKRAESAQKGQNRGRGRPRKDSNEKDDSGS